MKKRKNRELPIILTIILLVLIKLTGIIVGSIIFTASFWWIFFLLLPKKYCQPGTFFGKIIIEKSPEIPWDSF